MRNSLSGVQERTSNSMNKNVHGKACCVLTDKAQGTQFKMTLLICLGPVFILSPCFQGSKDQLEGVWEETDKMDPEDFDPKTFFKFHGMWGFICPTVYMI